jgi:hypothetical protein
VRSPPDSPCVQRFRTWSILAYECGFKEEDIALQLTAACDLSKSVVPAALVMSCLEGICIIWLTLEQSARPVTRWAKGMLPAPRAACLERAHCSARLSTSPESAACNDSEQADRRWTMLLLKQHPLMQQCMLQRYTCTAATPARCQ